ncbi:Tim22 [Blastocystis hominis]|uniref:Mitochondrial import inner membrane translocase subunit TIM22 n=1 Tax=Blastocystis hominis TaxID=12968 RepID=D8M9K7_BLAHO|nr:Tim22 [Blastocystis hominis]CBK24746.2 Tim22 [Blastocystis hominis]|eukprot:XP_012898794.1 Tim22 [Blastocystis hominis]
MESIDPKKLEEILLKTKPKYSKFPVATTIPKRESLLWLYDTPPNRDKTFNYMPSNIGEISNSCFIRGLQNLVLAVPLGAGFGLFMGAFSLFTSGMPYVGNVPEKTTATTLLQEFKKPFRFMYLRGKGSARMMASFGAVYGGLECVIERVVGRKNILTNAIAGCGVGLVTGSKRGLQVLLRLE